MSTAEYRRKLEELDRLLNDPDVPMQPDRIWALLADVPGPRSSPPPRRQRPLCRQIGRVTSRWAKHPICVNCSIKQKLSAKDTRDCVQAAKSA